MLFGALETTTPKSILRGRACTISLLCFVALRNAKYIPWTSGVSAAVMEHMVDDLYRFRFGRGLSIRQQTEREAAKTPL